MSSTDKPGKPETRMLDDAKAAAPGTANTDDIETHILATSSDKTVAWLTVTAGPGVGQRRPVKPGTNSIGRDPGQNRIALDFNDQFMSRAGHAVLVNDPKTGAFRLLDGGKANSVKINGSAVTGERPLKLADLIEIGTTTLRLDPA